ncbi:MAG: DUF1127 domain-containing protein [Rhodospirillaceae bacterium]|jgi:uncharacterized protein YjiS (DUF1127 family)|nr:DUF1127 domain-containing protein [Rhodospirillaceae bacterium]MBT6286725.1 DUF1127 domain-containing protein [Rhodospirillaceae bacterium]
MFCNLTHNVCRIGAVFCVWQGRYRQRRALIALSDRALHDIGIGRSEAWGEHAKPFWRS